ncbi:lantibiotic dehydratase C-terminal domain-containing protein [Streptomyces sp. NPDC020096]
MTRTWHSWHLHLDSFSRDLADRALTTVVAPAVAALEQREPDAPWFFVRYWQRGPHLRLRCRTACPSSLEDVLHERFAQLPAPRPTARLTQRSYRSAVARTAAVGELGVPLDVGELRAPGVYRQAYRPEEHRYGGRRLMDVSEDVFHASSRAALALVRARADDRILLTDGLRTLATGIGALLPPWSGPAPAAGPARPDDMAVLRTWLSRALRITEGFLPSAAEGGDEAGRARREQAALAGARLAARPRPLLAALYGNDSQLAELAAKFRTARTLWCDAERAGCTTVTADAILGSHLHMAANRLGLGGTRELHLMTALERALAELASAAPHGKEHT